MKKHSHKHYPEIYVDTPHCFHDCGLDVDSSQLAIYPMSALDEIQLRVPDGLFNGHSVVNLIENCIPEIKSAWQLPFFALNYLLIAIRVATNGGDLDQTVTCPSCNAENEYGVNLFSSLDKLSQMKLPLPLFVDNFKFSFKSIDYKNYIDFSIQTFENQKIVLQIQDQKIEISEEESKALTEKIYNLQFFWLAHNIKSIEFDKNTYTDFNDIKNILENIDQKIFTKLTQIVTKSVKQLAPELQFTCDDCKFQFKSELNLDYGAMFRNMLLHKTPQEINELVNQYEKDVQTLKRDILECAWLMRGGVSYNELLNMGYKERKIISKIAEEHIKITEKTKLPYF